MKQTEQLNSAYPQGYDLHDTSSHSHTYTELVGDLLYPDLMS